MRTLTTCLFAVLLFGACTETIDSNSPPPSGPQQAYIPIYATPTDLDNIGMETARPTTNAGKIYVYGNYLFQNEMNKGIHIIDRSLSQPAKKAFLRVPYSTEVAVRGHYLYTNTVSDMIVIDIADPQNPVVVKRIKGAFAASNQDYPPYSNVNFECVDHTKGIVVGWELRSVQKVNCRR